MTARIDTAKEREFLAALDGHTPGPWFRDCWDILSDGLGTGAVCDVAAPGDSDEHYWTDGEADSNARLISASPELKTKYATALNALDAMDAEIEWIRTRQFEIITERNDAETKAKKAEEALDAERAENRRLRGELKEAEDRAQGFASKEFHTEGRAKKAETENERLRKALNIANGFLNVCEYQPGRDHAGIMVRKALNPENDK